MAKKPAEIDVVKLTEAQARAELKRLASEIAAHDRRYYQEDAPAVTAVDRHCHFAGRAPLRLGVLRP